MLGEWSVTPATGAVAVTVAPTVTKGRGGGTCPPSRRGTSIEVRPPPAWPAPPREERALTLRALPLLVFAALAGCRAPGRRPRPRAPSRAPDVPSRADAPGPHRPHRPPPGTAMNLPVPPRLPVPPSCAPRPSSASRAEAAARPPRGATTDLATTPATSTRPSARPLSPRGRTCLTWSPRCVRQERKTRPASPTRWAAWWSEAALDPACRGGFSAAAPGPARTALAEPACFAVSRGVRRRGRRARDGTRATPSPLLAAASPRAAELHELFVDYAWARLASTRSTTCCVARRCSGRSAGLRSRPRRAARRCSAPTTSRATPRRRLPRRPRRGVLAAAGELRTWPTPSSATCCPTSSPSVSTARSGRTPCSREACRDFARRVAALYCGLRLPGCAARGSGGGRLARRCRSRALNLFRGAPREGAWWSVSFRAHEGLSGSTPARWTQHDGPTPTWRCSAGPPSLALPRRARRKFHGVAHRVERLGVVTGVPSPASTSPRVLALAQRVDTRVFQQMFAAKVLGRPRRRCSYGRNSCASRSDRARRARVLRPVQRERPRLRLPPSRRRASGGTSDHTGDAEELCPHRPRPCAAAGDADGGPVVVRGRERHGRGVSRSATWRPTPRLTTSVVARDSDRTQPTFRPHGAPRAAPTRSGDGPRGVRLPRGAGHRPLRRGRSVTRATTATTAAHGAGGFCGARRSSGRARAT